MVLRDLLPWRAFTIESSWSPGVVATELRKRMDERRIIATGGDAPLVGTASEDGRTFRFWRAIATWGSAVPTTMLIVAVVEPSHHDGARLRVRMRLAGIATAMSVVVGAGAILVALLGVWMLLGGNAIGLALLAFPVLAAAGGSILVRARGAPGRADAPPDLRAGAGAAGAA